MAGESGAFVRREPFALGADELPALFAAADFAALRGQRRHLRVVRSRLVSLLLAAGFAALAMGADGDLYLVGTASLAAFAVALGCELYSLTVRPERDWYEGRAAAESAKTLAWRYSVGGVPYELDLESRRADALLIAALRDVLHDLNLTLPADTRTGEQITPAMRSVRAQPLLDRMRAYEEGRVESQRKWYAAKSTWNERRSTLWTLASICLDVAGIVGASLVLFRVIEIDVRGLIATAGTSATAWVQARQHGTLATAYAVAAQELAAIRSELPSHNQEDEWSQFVSGAEEAISREHTLWRSSRGVKAR